MMGVRSGTLRVWIIVAGIVLVGAYFLQYPTMYEDSYYVCANTLSRRGHTEWPFGLKSSHWQTASPLEEYLTTHEPDSIVHDRLFSNAAGKSLYGQATMYVDGAPPIGHMIAWNHLEAWISATSKEEVLGFYELLKAGDRERIREKIAEINASWLQSKTESRQN